MSKTIVYLVLSLILFWAGVAVGRLSVSVHLEVSRRNQIAKDLAPQLTALSGAYSRWLPVVLISEETFQTFLPILVQQDGETLEHTLWRAERVGGGVRIVARAPQWTNGQWKEGYPPFKFWYQQDLIVAAPPPASLRAEEKK